MTTMNDPLVGTTYDGRYRIERRIGAGGMANVYLAQDETLGRRVAIKVLHQRYAEDSQFIERFLREASAAARLNHPNIVQVYDRGQGASTYYIAMEFVDGMTLKDLVRRRGALTEQEVLAYARQALHALRFAHRNGIVHRDVKPHNMMVDTDGRLKIADFGIARAAADADSGLTEAGSIVGTAQYLSPEQAQGLDVAASSDLYSLGVVMFEMATGRVPFDGDSPVNVALKHVKDPAPRPSTYNSSVTPQIESIILKAMQKDPAQRYHSADEMLADLDRAREGSQTSAMTQVLGGAAIGAIGATAVTPITPTPVRAYETPVPPEPAWPESGWEDEDPTERRKAWRWILPALIVLLLIAAAAWFLLVPKGEPVPDVVGLKLRAAQSALVADGFETGTVTNEPSSDEPKGVVIDQDPSGGRRAEKGTKIDLVVSSGPAQIDVPNVVGKSRAQAKNTLEAAGFTVAFGEPEASDKNAGIVLRQTPDGGKADPNSTVRLVVSSGPEDVTVPGVEDMTESAARELLEGGDGKFVVKVEPVDSPAAAGTVVSQSPSPNTTAAPGSTVVIRVASGSNAVPDVSGSAQDVAIADLEQAGFKTEVVTEATEDATQVGIVQSTNPAAGARQRVGSTIRVTVGELSGDAGDGGIPPDA